MVNHIIDEEFEEEYVEENGRRLLLKMYKGYVICKIVN